MVIIEALILMEKGRDLLKRSLEKSREQMSSNELTNNYVVCGTSSSLPCNFVFLNFGKKLFLKYVGFWDIIDVSTAYFRTPTTNIKYIWAISLEIVILLLWKLGTNLLQNEKALRSFKICVLVNNNLCGKLFSS